MDEEQSINDIKHFNKLFGFVVAMSFVLLVFMAALIFLPLPPDNKQMANMTLSFLFGAFSGTTGVLIITNPQQRKETGNIPANSKVNSTTVTDTVTDNTKV